MTRKQQIRLIRILISAVILIAGMLSPLSGVVQLIVFLAAYLIAGYDVLLRAVKNIFRGNIFDENFLMALATVGALLIQEYPEGVAVMVFYQVGELFQDIAVAKSRRSISELMDLRPDYANILVDGALQKVDPDEVAVGDVFVVKPGEKIPLDGVIREGESFLDTAALTGESIPRQCHAGDEVLSGFVNGSGILQITASKSFGESTASKILDMVENAAAKKTRAENFITKFARYYTPAVVIAAVLLAFLPPMILSESFAMWIHRALIFLVVSCPCALVISVPLAFFGGLGGASKAGVLIKGSNYFEGLSKVSTVVFDKTGTLTKGKFVVSKILPEGVDENTLLEIAAHAEAFSSHPIAVSIREKYGKVDETQVSDVKEIAGKGTSAVYRGKPVLAGNAALMETAGITPPADERAGTVVYTAYDGQYIGSISISDTVKPDSAETVHTLKAMGIKTVMLTGDNEKTAAAVAKQVGVDTVYAGLLPADKVEYTEQLLAEKKDGSLIFVGDGINDAPVLSRADVGIAMGGVGSDAATEAADAVIMKDDPSAVLKAIRIAKKTMRIARQNIVFALAVKFAVLILGALGFATMWDAVFADVGVAILAILNSVRTMKQS